MSGHKYQELALKLRQDIRNGVYRTGQRLPSENELTAATGYSRQTVRQAMALLEDEGLTDRIRGSGTYVRSRVPGPQTHLQRGGGDHLHRRIYFSGDPAGHR